MARSTAPKRRGAKTDADARDVPVSRLDPQERRLELVTRRLAEMAAQKDWRLLETGRFLHDDLGQLLTAAGIRLDLIANSAGGNGSGETADAVHLLQELLEQSMLKVRSWSEDLNRSTADRLGLRPALERLIDKWEPAVCAQVDFACPLRLKLGLLQSRVVVRMAEFAFELAANRLNCRRVEIRAKETTRKCVFITNLHGVSDPHKEPENEVHWRILRASAELAGGEAEIDVAFGSEDVTIMRAEFPTKFPTGFSTVEAIEGNEGQNAPGS